MMPNRNESKPNDTVLARVIIELPDQRMEFLCDEGTMDIKTDYGQDAPNWEYSAFVKPKKTLALNMNVIEEKWRLNGND